MPSLLDRIEHVPIASLSLFPGNARKGDIPAIAESLRENGQVSPLVVQRSTSHVLGGNNTLQAALSLGWDEIDVVFIDVGDQRASRINAALNRTADRATYDEGLLLAQLAGLDDLDGTGYGLDDLDELRRVTGAFGRDATSFLDPYLNPPDPGQPSGGDDDSSGESAGSASTGPPAPGAAAAQEPLGPEWVQVAWVVTPGSRDTIRRAIGLAQQRGGLATAAEGLLAMAAHYLNTVRD